MFVTIPNVLANRYASDEMVAIWSPEAKVVAERRLWLAVLRAQAELGVPVPSGVVEDYEGVLEDVDLSSIAARERVTRHDVKARIDAPCVRAGASRPDPAPPRRGGRPSTPRRARPPSRPDVRPPKPSPR